MDVNTLKSVYFIGAGGIGMSALVRYFLSKGKKVGGYDRTPSELTEKLIEEGAAIHYEESTELITDAFRDPATTLVVYTPAVPDTHKEFTYFRENGFEIHKRSQVLGMLTHAGKGLCVAGTHGKTTTSTMTAHLLHQSHVGCNAFLGGISKNYGTNLLLSDSSEYMVIEADEFDRSFHWLSPYISVITATDPDHLDIYGTKEAYLESFRKYTSLIQPGGALIVRKGIELQPALQNGVKLYTYSQEEGDFHAENIRIGNGEIFFDYVSPLGNIPNIQLGVPVSINIENGVAAMALAQMSGLTDEEIKRGMASFRGVDRRFDFKIKNDKVVFLSDYAHHPSEIKQSILSMRALYRDKKLTAVFQPHLYTRTRDFYKDFADSLSLLDEVILVDIYPAREQPIPGVTSKLIYDHLRPGIEKSMCKKEEILDVLSKKDIEVLITLGAGDIDNYVPQICGLLNKNDKENSHTPVSVADNRLPYCSRYRFQHQACRPGLQGYGIDYQDSIDHGFISQKGILRLLNGKKLSPVGKKMGDINTRLLEEELSQHPLIENVECYRTPGCKIGIEVTQRLPILRVMANNGDNYYIDNKGKIMPIPNSSAHVAVVTGYVDRDFAVKELYTLGVFLQAHPLWDAQIEQINVTQAKELELVPRVGEHIIFLGKPGNYEEKFEKLKTFYEKGLNQVAGTSTAASVWNLIIRLFVLKKRSKIWQQQIL